ncbi:class I SAM-dependent methyltransferase [Chelatococcus reniformis]|uniref:class I SAM-dependent methyltransferase n=1 Tax=Chelatococcus reniformis TaxID=1494448 RepID=UPI00166CB24D|nr:class I SAM-dependent methyltransferase [Chelatococcus reniformis]
MTLTELADRHGTDKGTDPGDFGEAHHYTEIYERFLEPLRDRPLRVIEIGVWKGGSLRMWEDYLPNATIVGIEKTPDLIEHRFERATIAIGDATDRQFLDAVVDRFAEREVDVVIDDGSHVLEDQIVVFEHVMQRLAMGGLYFVEDIACSRFPQWNSGTLPFRDFLDYANTIAMESTFFREDAIEQYHTIRSGIAANAAQPAASIWNTSLFGTYVFHNMVVFEKRARPIAQAVAIPAAPPRPTSGFAHLAGDRQALLGKLLELRVKLGQLSARHAPDAELLKQLESITASASADEASVAEYLCLTERYPAEIAEHRSVRERLEQENLRLAQEVRKLTESVAVYETSNKDYRALTERYAAEIQDHWSVRSRVETENFSLSERVKQLSDSVAAYEASNNDYRVLTSRYVAEIEDHWSVRGRLEGEKQQLHQAVDEHGRVTERQVAELAQLQAVRETLLDDKAQLERTLVEQKKIADQQAAIITKLRSAQEALLGERRQHERRIEELAATTKGQAALIDAHASLIRHLEEEAGQLRDSLTRAERVLGTLVGRLARRLHG